MLLFIIGVLFLVLAIVGYRHSHTILSPYTLVAGEWGIIILLYFIFDPPFYSIEYRFPICIFLWVIGFYISSLFIDIYYKPRLKTKRTVNKKIWLFLLLLAVPTLIYFIYTKILLALSSPEYFAIMLRQAAGGNGDEVQENSIGIFAYFVSAVFVLYTVELIRYPAKKKLFFVLLLLNLSFGAVLLSKSYIIQIFMASLVIVSYRTKLSLKKLFIPIIMLFAIFVIMQTIRVEGDGETFGLKGFFNSYVFAGMVAFDRVPIDVSWDGSNVFRLYYTIHHAFDSSVKVADVILPYFPVGSKGAQINVYTGLYPFYSDYGYFGVAFFSVLYGIFYGYIYKNARRNNTFLIIYSILASDIVMFFMGDFVSAALSLLIQYSVYSYLLYFPSIKRHNSSQIK